MKYIAYKTAKNDPNFPDGFIVEHFETDKDALEGYSIATLEVFNLLFQNNVTLVRKAEVDRGVVTQNPNAPLPVLRPASDAEIVPSDLGNPGSSQDTAAELFNQFLAWVAAGKPGGAPPSNT